MSGSDTVNQEGFYGTRGIPDPANVPGARWQSISWIDSSGNLWLFGGFEFDNWGDMNDLWRYEPDTGMWTWISGSAQDLQKGRYGSRGESDFRLCSRSPQGQHCLDRRLRQPAGCSGVSALAALALRVI